MTRWIASLALASFLVLAPAAGRADMIIRDYQPARHDRFYTGADRAFLGEGFDFSGVGRGEAQGFATLITDGFIISAHHLSPSNPISFRATNDPSEAATTRNVVDSRRIQVLDPVTNAVIELTDLWIGRLDTALGSEFAPFAIAEEEMGRILGQEIWNYGLQHRLGRNVLERFRGVSTTDDPDGPFAVSYEFTYEGKPGVGGDETYLQGGDSGGPSFILGEDGQLALLGTHWYINNEGGSLYSADAYISRYLPQIRAEITAMGGNADALRTIRAVPEPGTLVLLGLGLPLAAIAARRRRCRRAA